MVVGQDPELLGTVPEPCEITKLSDHTHFAALSSAPALLLLPGTLGSCLVGTSRDEDLALGSQQQSEHKMLIHKVPLNSKESQPKP